MIGAFIGNSAVTWAIATRAPALASATVVTMDAWLGEVSACGSGRTNGSAHGCLSSMFVANIVAPGLWHRGCGVVGRACVGEPVWL